MSENTGSEAVNAREASSNPPSAPPGDTGVSVVRGAAPTEAAPDEAHVELGDEELELEEAPRPASGFQAFLQHANLHNLLQIESLSRTTGVFAVAAGERCGFLHLAGGELIHAELGELEGEAAAAEILSWGDGEFKAVPRPLAPVRTIHASLQVLLLRLAKAADGTARPEAGGARPALSPVLDDDAPTDPLAAASPMLDVPVADAAQRPLPPPRSAPKPPPLPEARGEAGPASLTEVVLKPGGEIARGRGPGVEELSARVAYAARLAELIGRAIRSGTPRALELRGRTTQTLVRWQAEGTLAASMDVVQNGRR